MRRALASDIGKRALHQTHPVGCSKRQGLVGEIIGRVVQARALAIADEDIGPGRASSI